LVYSDENSIQANESTDHDDDDDGDDWDVVIKIIDIDYMLECKLKLQLSH